MNTYSRTPAITLGLLAILLGPARPVGAFSGCPGSGQQSSGPDLITGAIGGFEGFWSNDILNYHSSGGIAAFSVFAAACNMGDQQVVWDGESNNHPVIAQNCFRLKTVNGSTRIEQLGQSWLKHGFAAGQFTTCCVTCEPAEDWYHLGLGCADPYSASQNGTQSDLGPKWRVNPTTGIHIDSVTSPPWSDSVARRLQVNITDLEVSDFVSSPTKYFVEVQYVTADDALAGNGGDNASYRPLAVSGGGTSWWFDLFGDDDAQIRRRSPGILAWSEYDTDVHIADMTTPEDAGLFARVILAGKATALGNGQWHYEYAVQNINSDRSIYSLAVPVSRYATVTNIDFHDVDYHSGDGIDNVTTDGTDWPGVRSVSAEQIAWAVTQTYAENANGNALRWGTMYNFRFDCNLPPAAIDGSVSLTQFKPGAQTMVGANVVPQAVTCLPGDMNADELIDGHDIARFTDLLVGGGGTTTERCAGDREASPDSFIDMDDMEGFVACVLAAGC